MKIDSVDQDGVTVVLDRNEVELLRLALERATFIDTPPGRQDEILRFADDLLRALPKNENKRDPGSAQGSTDR